MFFVSTVLKTILNKLPSWYVGIRAGNMKGVKWILKSANPGQALGRYEPEHESQFVKLLASSTTFWDVGAHVGWYTLLAAKNLPTTAKITAFEPNPKNIGYLKRHLKLNDVSNASVVEKALCNEKGVAFFSNRAQQSQLVSVGEYQVQTDRADSIVQNQPPPDFIKLDVEGAEVDFLNGAQQLIFNHRPRILLSAHGYKKRDECIRWLQQYGYAFDHLVSNQIEGDYVFYAYPILSNGQRTENFSE